MAAGRHSGRSHNLSRGGTFPLCLFLSVAIHVVFAAALIISQGFQEKRFYTPLYEVELLPAAETVRSVEVSQEKEVIQPKKPAKEKVKRKIHKGKESFVIPKRAAPSTDDAVKKIREKITIEEAVRNIREKVREKSSTRGIKISASAPAKVYRKEELEEDMKLYYDKILRLITENWLLPPFLSNKGYVAGLSIHVRKDGIIESMWIEKASGNKPYDESAFRAINRVGSLPPLPEGWKSDSIDLGLEF